MSEQVRNQQTRLIELRDERQQIARIMWERKLMEHELEKVNAIDKEILSITDELRRQHD